MRLPIPAAALKQHIAFLGKTGSGKTSTAKLVVEQILREDPNARVCVLDPIKSDWWGLTSSANGRNPGLPFYILGGPRGHVQLHDSAGKAIGELVANGALPLSIIDMADFKPGGLQRFFSDFAPALMKRMRGVVYLVFEEVHEIVPKERTGIGAESMAIHYAKQLATAGRSKGIRLMIVTQRTQALHNALLGSCDTMIAHRLTAPADQEPVKKWLKANVSKEIFDKVSTSLASLKTGSAWICSGEAQVAELVQFPKISTFDNSATPTGNEASQEVKTAPVDQDKLRAIIGTAVKEAERAIRRLLGWLAIARRRAPTPIRAAL
jgi:Helicase HerA, central domain